MAASSPAGAAERSSGTLRLALLERSPLSVGIQVTGPLEHLVAASSGAAILDERLVPAYYNGADFRFRVEGLVEQPATQTAVALDAGSELALVFPPEPDFLEALASAAADPASYDRPNSLAFASRPIRLDSAPGPQGETLISVLVDAGIEPAQWRNTLAKHHRLRWRGKEISVIAAGRVFGQIGRLASAVGALPAAPLGLSRGNLFTHRQPGLHGVEMVRALSSLGLRYAAVNSLEIRFWDQLAAYRSAEPDGVRFLSANLVYSSAPAVSVFPPYDVVPAGDLKAAIVGLTPPRSAKYLGQAGLSHLTVLDPVEALEARLPELRAKADMIVALIDLDDDTADLPLRARGVDLIVGRTVSYPASGAPPETVVSQTRRTSFQPPLLTMTATELSLDVLEAAVSVENGFSRWSVNESHRLLDDSIEPAPGWPEFDPQSYGITFSTDPALLPAARALFPETHNAQITPRQFWTLAAGLAAAEAGAEASVLRVWSLPVTLTDAVKESVVRVWLSDDEPAVLVSIKGSDLKRLMSESQAQGARERLKRSGGPLLFAVGGVTADLKIDGSPIEDGLDYTVLTSRVMADALGLGAPGSALPVGRTVDEIVLDGLKRRADRGPSEIRRWMEGLPVTNRGLWRINFRDVGLNVQNTKVVRDDRFNTVPNSRIQGFDELLVGYVFKTDAEYLRDAYRWSNTLEMEYARSRLRPRDQPAVTNTTANRITFLTSGSRRAGLIRQQWFARSWGPSLGLQYDGQFEATPGLRRKQIYSAYPGVSFFDGNWVRLFELSGNVKRDLSREPPNTQPGLHTRLIVSRELSSSGARLESEVYANYFFLTRRDTDQDLRLEGDANLKLRVPIRKYLSISPFVDFYFFALKTRPIWGYSAMTGVQIGFSRLWKPRYQPLLGDR